MIRFLGMDRDALAQLAVALQRSIEMREALQQKISGKGFVDLLKEWEDIERLDHEITRQIRKRPPE